MKTLLLLRHAKSSWKDAEQHDFDRPLNARGEHEAPLVGAYLAENDLLPDLIAASAARRTRATAELVIEASGYRGETRFVPALYEADAARLRALVESLPDSCSRAMLIGHNPGLEDFFAEISGESAALKTCALAQLEFDAKSWPDFARHKAQVIRLWRPKDEEGES